jgi:hypothetical protein
MDAARFDSLTRLLSNPSSRRGVWRGVAAATLGLAAARLPGAVTARKKRKHKKNRRKKPKACANGTETCLGQCVAHCPSGQVRNPLTCGCCQANSGACNPPGFNDDCCSGICTRQEGSFCSGRGIAESCEFDAQCATGACSPFGECLFGAP